MAIERTTDGGKPWRVRWRALDGAERSRRCSDRKTAAQLEADILRCHERGVEWEPATPSAPPALADVAARYQDARRMRVSRHTLRVEGGHLDVFLRFCEAHRHRTIADLDRAMLDDFLGWLLDPKTSRHGKVARKPGSASRVVGAALLLWQWAEDSGRFPGIPRAPRELDLPRSRPAPVVSPSWAEMDACIAACRGWQVKLATWLRYTGLRVGESVLFEWSHVDMTRGQLTIPPELDKNGVGRVVPLHPTLLDEIATWGKREGYVVPVGRAAREDSGRDLRRPWKRSGAREALYAQHPAHAFRRGFKSGLVALGANADAVDFLQGHTLGGSRGRYIDGSMLPLAETLAMVPVIGKAAAGNVVALPKRR